MAKKSSSMTAGLLENSIDFVEKQLVSSVSDLLRNVTLIADIFFPPAPHHTPDPTEEHLLNDSTQLLDEYQKNITSIFYSNNYHSLDSNSANSVPINDHIFNHSFSYDQNNSSSVNNNYNYTRQLQGGGCPGTSSDYIGFFTTQLTDFYIDLLRASSNFALFLFVLWIFNRIVLKSKVVSTLIKVLFSWTIVALLFPSMVLFFGVILTGRLCVGVYLKLRHNGKIFLAHPMDSSWAFEKFGSPSTCTGLYIIKGKCDMTKILARMEEVMKLQSSDGQCLLDRMKYSLRNYFGYICWERLEDFNLNRQVKLISDKNPSLSPDRPMTEQDLFDELQRIHDQPFSDPNLSPWEILIIPKFIYGKDGKDNGDNHYALVFRIHHAVMDGVSTGNALYCMADKPFKFSIDPVDPLKVGAFKTFLAYFISFLMVPIVTLKNLTLVEKSCIHGPTLTGKKTFTWSRPVKLNSLKELKNKTKSSVFAVLMTCLGGSVRKLFVSKGEPVPPKITAAPPVAILPFPDRKPRNRFSIVLFPIEIGLADVLERLEAVSRAAKTLASSSDILANFYILNLLGMMPLILIKVLGYFVHATMTLSNIPGPSEVATLFGNDPIVDVGAWVPVKNTIGIGMALFSYADRLRVTIIGDEACLTNKNDVAFLKDEFENELKDLATRVGMEQGIFIPEI